MSSKDPSETDKKEFVESIRNLWKQKPPSEGSSGTPIFAKLFERFAKKSIPIQPKTTQQTTTQKPTQKPKPGQS